MLRLALIPIALAVVAGCASEAPAPAPKPAVQASAQPASGVQVAAVNPNERKQVCVREQPIGSAIPVTKCHYEDDAVNREMNIGAFENQVHRSTPATNMH